MNEISIDATRVIVKLSETVGRLTTDLAVKDAYIEQQADLIAEQQKTIDELAKRLSAHAPPENGRTPGRRRTSVRST